MYFAKVSALGSALCVLGGASLAVAAPVPEASWSFNNDVTIDPVANTTTVTDDSGNGHTVSYVKALAVATGDSPYGAGQNSLNVNVPANGSAANVTTLTWNTNFTIAGWIKPSDVNDTTATDYFIQNVGGGAGVYLAMGRTGEAGKVWADVYTGTMGHQVFYSANQLVANEWNFVALTYDGTTASLYVLYGGSPPNTALSLTTLAASGSAGSGHPQNNIIASNNSKVSTVQYADLSIYNTTLSASDLQSMIPAVPEPASLSVLALGGLLMIRRRKSIA